MASGYGYDDRNTPFYVSQGDETTEISDMRSGQSVFMPNDVFREMVVDWATTEAHWNPDHPDYPSQ